VRSIAFRRVCGTGRQHTEFGKGSGGGSGTRQECPERSLAEYAIVKNCHVWQVYRDNCSIKEMLGTVSRRNDRAIPTRVLGSGNLQTLLPQSIGEDQAIEGGG
jgi:hypothetical protein